LEKDWDSELDRITRQLPLDLLINELQPEVFVEYKDGRSLPHEEMPDPAQMGRQTRSRQSKKGVDAFTCITPKPKRNSSGDAQTAKKRKSRQPIRVQKGDNDDTGIIATECGRRTEQLSEQVIPLEHILKEDPLQHEKDSFWAEI
jgi:hypothetical protein